MYLNHLLNYIVNMCRFRSFR